MEVRVDQYHGFREFMTARSGQLSRFAYMLTGDHHAAEDLLQTALAKVAVRWRKISRYEQPEAFVRRVMVNEHISGWRKRRKLIEHATSEIPDTVVVPDPSDATVRQILVNRALAQLSPRQRAVLVLRFYEDLTEVQTAAELGISVGTVKSHAHDALAKLRSVASELADLLRDDSEVTA